MSMYEWLNNSHDCYTIAIRAYDLTARLGAEYLRRGQAREATREFAMGAKFHADAIGWASR